MTRKFPDIEIYIKGVERDVILEWLCIHFEIVDQQPRHDSYGVMLSRNGKILEGLIVEKAAKGGFTSLWLKSDNTPWENDRECALEAAVALDCEVRCSTGSWNENDDQPGWLRITANSESPVNWL